MKITKFKLTPEPVFPTRDWIKGESWHIAQNNVFFHALDDIDTSETMIIMTTNMLDLMDKAVVSRLYVVEFPPPSLEVKKSVAEQRCKELHMEHEGILKEIEQNENKYSDLRKVLELVMERYVEQF